MPKKKTTKNFNKSNQKADDNKVPSKEKNIALEASVDVKNYTFYDSSKVFFYDIFFKLIISFVIVYVISSIAVANNSTYLEFVQQRSWLGFLITLISPVFLLILFVCYNKTNKINFVYEYKPKAKLNVLMILICFAISCVCLFMMGGVFNCIDYLIVKAGYVVSGELVFEINNFWKLLLAIFSMAVLPAIFEELVYRGIVMKGLLSKFKPWIAITVSAILFALMHGSLDQTFFQLFLGLILGFVAYKTHNIIYPILIHFFNNVIVLILNYVQSTVLVGYPENLSYVIISVLLFIGGAGLLVGICYLIIKYFTSFKNENVESAKKSDKLGLIGFLNSTSKSEKLAFFGGVAVAVLIWLINTASGFVG